jgi:sugar phosphate isomerase/epimerase
MHRREFFKETATGAAALAAASACGSAPLLPPLTAAPALPYELGMASYTFREFPLEKALEMTVRLGLKRIAFKDFHLKLDSTDEQIAAAVAKVKQAGLDLYGGGVIYMRSEADVNNAFAYAKKAGMRIIIGVPNHDLLDLVNRKVQEYDIRVAVHNHGPGDKVYPTPESAYEKIARLDRRIGLCIDVGHTMRSGIDPSVPALKYAERLIDVHIKDASAATADGSTVEIGRGVIDIPKFLRTLQKIRYSGTVSLEYEKDAKDPLPGSAESIGYLRGVLATMSSAPA